MKFAKDILTCAVLGGAIVGLVLLDVHLMKVVSSPDEAKRNSIDTQEICLSLRLTPGEDSTQLQLDNKDV